MNIPFKIIFVTFSLSLNFKASAKTFESVPYVAKLGSSLFNWELVMFEIQRNFQR